MNPTQVPAGEGAGGGGEDEERLLEVEGHNLAMELRKAEGEGMVVGRDPPPGVGMVVSQQEALDPALR
jgi:hypothetical protein